MNDDTSFGRFGGAFIYCLGAPRGFQGLQGPCAVPWYGMASLVQAKSPLGNLQRAQKINFH